MGRRYFTSDFHLSMEAILKFENRPFDNIRQHDNVLLDQCFKLNEDDVIYHIGDLFCYKQDMHSGQILSSKGSDKKPVEVLSGMSATFINIRGNHDMNNRVKSICENMRIRLSRRFPAVSLGHYPSYDIHAKDSFINGDIHLCGHIHHRWKHCLDLDHSVLNINVGVDAWDYMIISEDQLISYIESVIMLPKEKINKVKEIEGKIEYV